MQRAIFARAALAAQWRNENDERYDCTKTSDDRLGQDSRSREFTVEKRAALSRWSPGFSRSSASAFEEPPEGGTPTDAFALLGPDTLDIHLNAAAYWQNVPRRVWEYTLGGYQVLKKWLSYREAALLGRPLTVDEVAYLTHTIRRIAGLLLLAPQLDANYATVKADTHVWQEK